MCFSCSDADWDSDVFTVHAVKKYIYLLSFVNLSIMYTFVVCKEHYY